MIEDFDGLKFGAFLSDSIRIKSGFYGNGECFMFTFSKENNF
jgi:hypothetical protein